jgi:NAD(P)-dependent dehydrogenase (short-subunit alcohol dehydrogenase family)
VSTTPDFFASSLESGIICRFSSMGILMTESRASRVFITGAASGLGRSLAVGYARRGSRVGIADVNDDRAGETAEAVAEAGGEPLILHCDVRDDGQVEAAAAGIQEAWGGIDVIINNAGVAAAGTVVDTDLEDWRWIMDINLLGAVRVCQAFVPMMQRSRGGHVVNVASAAGIVQSPGMASYNVSKAAMIALSETLKNELGGFGIGVTVVCPSFFTTNLMESYRGPDPGLDLAGKLMARSRLSADDIAAAVIRAVDRNEFMVFGHREAGVAYHLKRLMPGVFYWSTARAAQKMLGNVVDLDGKGGRGE